MISRLVPALAAAVVATAAGASTVAANGRMPDSVKLVFRPGQPEHMLLGVTFGVMESIDGGATWRWACESAVGFSGTFDPDYELTASGALVAATFDGLKLTRDRCDWGGAPAPLGTTLVSSFAVGPDGSLWAGTSDFAAGSAIFKSTDDGVSFVPTARLGQPGDWLESIEVAPSDPARLYVTAFRLESGFPRRRLLFRTRDGGATWEELPTIAFIGTEISDLMIAAIHPDDPDRVFVRMTLTSTTVQERFYRSTDAGSTAAGGPTWQQVLEVPDYVQGFAIRANGEVWAGGLTTGLFRSTDGGQSFTSVTTSPPVNPRCLRERSDGYLYACGNNLPPDGAALTRSLDGVVWTPVLTYAAISSPFRCADGIQREDCEERLWCGLKEQFGITSTEVDCTDAGVDAPTNSDSGSGCCDARGGTGIELVVGLLLLRPRRRAHKAATGA